jgi:uncharacterized protein
LGGRARRGGRVRFAVRLTPKSSTNRVLGRIEDGDVGWAVKIAVTALPVDGKANAALVDFLARQLGVAARHISVVGGASHRRKLVEIAGDPVVLTPLIEQRLAACSKQS